MFMMNIHEDASTQFSFSATNTVPCVKTGNSCLVLIRTLD